MKAGRWWKAVYLGFRFVGLLMVRITIPRKLNVVRWEVDRRFGLYYAKNGETSELGLIGLNDYRI